MGNPAVIELDLPPADLALLRRLRRAPGDDPRDEEIHRLRLGVNELGDKLAALRCALNELKVEILDLAETGVAWRELAEAAWPEEVGSNGR